MDATELKATIARVDEMRERCQALIKDKPLRPDTSVGRKQLTAAVRPAQVTHKPQATAAGQLAGNEMDLGQLHWSGYRPRKPTFVDTGDGSIDSIFADFEAAFDEMAQAHRA